MYSSGQVNGNTNGTRHGNSLERVAIFLDFHNLFPAMRDCGGQLNLIRLRDYLSEGRHLLDTFLYIGTRPSRMEADLALHHQLRLQNFFVRTKIARIKADGSLKCDFDVDMAVDALEFARNVRPDIVVLGTGDRDFCVVAERLRLMGVRVEVASTRETVSAELLATAHDFIDLGTVVSEVCNQPIALNGEARTEV
jgi:uncharacterized LabA/DUF88 family protein